MSIISGYRKYGFDAYGEKILKAEHMLNWMDIPMRVDPKGISFEIGAGIDEVEDGFFMLLPTIRELFILSPSCNIIMSNETIQLFQRNQVLIRGDFDGTAEAFAKKYGLRFLHRDVRLAMVGDYSSPGGTDIVTLCFKENGSAYIHQDNQCEYGGNENSIDLPDNFYNSFDEEYIANKCWNDRCSELVKASGVLKELLEKAKIKGGFFIDYSKKKELHIVEEIKGPFNCMNHMMEKALFIALKAHSGQEDKAGCPYINHPLSVATFCAGDPMAMTVALLHDVVEDTDYTFEELEKDFPAEVIDALRLVTHPVGEPYMDYIRRIKESGNAIALKVKIADMRHNMDISRLENPDERAIWRLEEKYKPAWKYLHE